MTRLRASRNGAKVQGPTFAEVVQSIEAALARLKAGERAPADNAVAAALCFIQDGRAIRHICDLAEESESIFRDLERSPHRTIDGARENKIAIAIAIAALVMQEQEKFVAGTTDRKW